VVFYLKLFMSDIIDYLNNILVGYIREHNLGEVNFVIEKPKDQDFGDISTNMALVISKRLNKKPREIAEEISVRVEQAPNYSRFFRGSTIAGPGFVNWLVSDNYYREKLKHILSSGNSCGKSSLHEGKTANIEWVSANPTGPLHAGHGRHIALGKAVASLLEWSGYNVTREYYYNDAGKQMDNLAKSVYARYRRFFEPDYALPEDAYIGDYITEIAELIKKEYGDKLVNSENDLDIFKTAGENWCFKSIRHTLNRIGITHDVFFSEQSLYKDGKVKKILVDFKNRKLSYEKDGAIWLRLSELKDENGKQIFENDKVIVKSTGEPTYRLPDMAYHIDKLNRGYDWVVDIFGSDHSDTYKEVLAGVGALGYDTSKIKVIIHQMVTFVHDGKPVKMSKRSDNVYYLDDLLDDVGEDVAQFFFVMRSANTHLDFDIKLAKEQSEKNPVFYLQYAHARICGILRNADAELPDYKKIKAEEMDFSVLKEPEEIDVIKTLTYFPEIVESAASSYEPHKIITYLNEIAENYHRFYHNHRVLNAGSTELAYARLKLCEAVKTVLKNGFTIIGINAPERM
jgi:arginyl-tRNA synthetase